MIEVGTPDGGPRDIEVGGVRQLPDRVGVLPLRDTVTFPEMLIPLNVGPAAEHRVGQRRPARAIGRS